VSFMAKATKKTKGAKAPELEPIRLLDDEPALNYSEDDLGVSPFARVIAGAAIGTRGPFTIGVYGEWGHGKTSLLRQAQSMIDEHVDLKSDNPMDQPITVWFNAWQYEREEHPVVSLLATIALAIEARQRDILESKHINERDKETVLKALRKSARALRAMAYGFSFTADAKVPLVGGVEVAMNAKDMIDRYDELESKAAERDPLLAQSMYFNAFELLKKLGDDAPHIVVFVDDLDRCDPDQAIRLIENIKLAMAHPGFVFALAVSRRIIEGHIEHRYTKRFGIDRFNDGARYLDKIVQLPLFIPSHRDRFKDYTIKLIDTRLTWIDEDTRTILRSCERVLTIGCRASPRSLVRLINNLLVDIPLAQHFSIVSDEADSISHDAFIRSAVISRCLRLSIRRDDDYDTLSRNRDLCDFLHQRVKSARDVHDVLSELASNSSDFTDPSGRVKSMAERLCTDEAFAELLADKSTREWLKNHAARKSVDAFMASSRESDLPEEPQKTNTLLNGNDLVLLISDRQKSLLKHAHRKTRADSLEDRPLARQVQAIAKTAATVIKSEAQRGDTNMVKSIRDAILHESSIQPEVASAIVVIPSEVRNDLIYIRNMIAVYTDTDTDVETTELITSIARSIVNEKS